MTSRRPGGAGVWDGGCWTRSSYGREAGLAAMTLTTFADVPWNAPYYGRLGWRVLSPADLSPGLVRIREHEAARDLDRWPRVAMRFDIIRAGLTS